MGVSGGPNIIEDGLVLCLDAGSTKSYPDSGNTWYNLSGNNHSTLTNGPVFNSTNGGSIDFDGVNDRIETNISVSIGNADLITEYDNETKFISSGTIPDDYRNNHTVKLAFLGNEYLDGTQYKSKHSILVESKIRFDFEILGLKLRVCLALLRLHLKVI